MEIKDLQIKLKIWFEFEGEQIMGPGLYRLFKEIEETGSLSKAAKECGYSYKYAWSKIKKVEDRCGKPFVIASKGGFGGGGSMILTDFAVEIMRLYEEKIKSLDSKDL
jgi:molybdate transport system regulatory protein